MKDKLTVVLLNWARPNNVHTLIRHYAAMPLVREIIVFDNNPLDLRRKEGLCVPLEDKLRYIHAHQDMGLASRFAAAGLARTDAVLLTDDDIELPQETVEDLYARWSAIPWSVHGLHGRNPGDGPYEPRAARGVCEIVLTRAAMAHRRVCCFALGRTIDMANEVGGEPHGNGEDIVLSFCAMHLSGRLNIAYHMPFVNRDATDAHSISVRYADHHGHRTRVVAWCRQNLLYPHNQMREA